MKTSIGKIALEVSVGAIKGAVQQGKLNDKAVGWLIAHDSASKAFSGSKNATVKRDDLYSETKKNHVVASVKEVLERFFDGVVISGGKEESVEPATIATLRALCAVDPTLRGNPAFKALVDYDAQVAKEKPPTQEPPTEPEKGEGEEV